MSNKGHAGILIRKAKSTEQPPVYFTENKLSVTLGSGHLGFTSTCSKKVLGFTLAKGQLSVISLNELGTSFRLIRADESEALLRRGQSHNIPCGDTAFVRLTGSGSVLQLKILMDRAPTKPAP